MKGDLREEGMRKAGGNHAEETENERNGKRRNATERTKQ